MPIPVLLGVVPILIGAKKLYDAHSHNKEAERVNSRAQDIVKKAKDDVDDARKGTYKALGDFGKAKVTVLHTSVAKFIDLFGKLHNVELEDSEGLNELRNLRADIEDLRELRELSSVAFSALQSGVSGVGAGVLAAFGAYNGVMAFGTASTGAAIAGLHGVAATNATLAFLGGGSLATGGLGMAGGMAVLGGIVSGVFLAVMGYSMSSKAEANLDIAYSNLSEAKKIKEQAQQVVENCGFIKDRANMFRRLLLTIEDEYFNPMLERLEELIDKRGVDFAGYNRQEREIVAVNCAVAQAVKAILDTPLLTEDGELTKESEAAIRKAKEKIAGLQDRVGA